MKVRVGSVLSYFGAYSDQQGFSYLPLLNAASLERLGQQTIKSFEVAISGVRDFSRASTDSTDFEDAIENMAEVFGTPSVRVKVQSRVTQRMNQDGVIAQIRRLLKKREETSSIKAIRAETEEEVDPYNFIEQLIKEKETLAIPDNEPVENRSVRMRFLERAYAKHQNHIRRILGVA